MTLYVPQKIDDLFYNKDMALKLKSCIERKQPVLIYGPPGVGKTSSVYAVANELKLPVVDINGSDERGKAQLAGLVDRARIRGFYDVIYFIDEADGIKDWTSIEKLLVKSKHPVVIAANEIWEIPDLIKNRCEQLKYQNPTLLAVADLVKKVGVQKGIKPHFELIGHGEDFRSGLLSSLYGGTRHESSDIFKDVERFIKEGVIPADPNPQLLIWLMDNASSFFYGSKLVEFILVLSRVDLMPKSGVVNRYLVVAQFRAMRSQRITYPNYLKRIGVLRRKKAPKS